MFYEMCVEQSCLSAKSLQWWMHSASSSSVTYERPIFSMLACMSPHMVIELKLSATCAQAMLRVWTSASPGQMHRLVASL